MKNTLKFISIGLALVLLVMSQQMSISQPAEAALDEDAIKFQSDDSGSGQDANQPTAGTTVKHYAADDKAYFWIKDGALNSVHSGTTIYIPSDQDDSSGATNTDGNSILGDDPTATAALHTDHVVALATDVTDCGHNLTDAGDDALATSGNDNTATRLACVAMNVDYTGAATPVVPGSLVVQNATVSATGTLAAPHTGLAVTATSTINNLDYIDEVNGRWGFALTRAFDTAAGTAALASYDFNMNDVQLRAKWRVKVTSTSDSTGEWITINEATAEGVKTAATNSSLFYGAVAFSTNAAAAAKDTTVGGGDSTPTVWVTSGDTITATYYKACVTDDNSDCETAGAVISSTTATIDSVDPTITNISPANGTLTNDQSPVLSFTIGDVGAGFNSSIANFHDHVKLVINGCNVVEATELSVTAHSSDSITFSYDLGGTTLWSADGDKNVAGDPATTVAQNNTTGLGKRCNNGADGETDAAIDRDQTTTGFFIDDQVLIIEDGSAAGTGATKSVGAANDRDRTIHGKEFNWRIRAIDEVGNDKVVEGTDLELTIDGKIPALVGTSDKITAAKAWDETDLKDVDDNSSIKLIFTETMNRTTITPADFIVSGTGVTDGTISTVKFGGTQGATDTFVYLDLAADLGPNAKPKVELVGQVEDLAGNIYKVPTSDADGKIELATATDGVKATLSGGALTDNYLDADEKSTITWVSNENMVNAGTTRTACSCVLVVGGNDDYTTVDNTDAVILAATLTSPTAGKYELQQGKAGGGLTDTAGIFGITPVGEDAAGNDGVGGVIKVTEDVSDQAAIVAGVGGGNTFEIKLANWPLADHDGDANLKDSVTAISENGTALPTANWEVDQVNWTTAETIDIDLLNADALAAGATVKITYYYVDPAYVVEVDTLKPGVTVSPTNDSSVTNKRQRITVTYNDDEYAGDTHLTTTLTKAELKDPDDVVTDILSEMISSDNKSYYYKPTSDFANGGYTLTISGEDEHGNARNDTTSKFTVKDRDQTVISMEAGWNLISLPAAPADSAINTVLTNAEINTVLTYDPTIPGGWLTAVRDGDVLSGTLTTVDSTRAYWVQQDDGDDIKVDIPGGDSAVTSLPAAIPVVKGWNLVPMIPLNAKTTVPALADRVEADTYFENIDWTLGKTWNRSGNGSWDNVRKGVDVTDTDEDGTLEVTVDTNAETGHDDMDLKPGMGYWIFANKAGTITP